MNHSDLSYRDIGQKPKYWTSWMFEVLWQACHNLHPVCGRAALHPGLEAVHDDCVWFNMMTMMMTMDWDNTFSNKVRDRSLYPWPLWTTVVNLVIWSTLQEKSEDHQTYHALSVDHKISCEVKCEVIYLKSMCCCPLWQRLDIAIKNYITITTIYYCLPPIPMPLVYSMSYIGLYCWSFGFLIAV